MNHLTKSEWILANAGSGKTTHLTERVVRLLLLGVPAERIVCITYTKAAASEMRSRVLSALRNLFIADDAARHQHVNKLLEGAATHVHIARAQQLFSAMLDSPTGGIVLTTIHGFCQTILRRFPLEAGVVPHFTVLEDAAADVLLREAKHTLLRDARRDCGLGEALALLGARGGESRFDTLTADIVKKRNLWKQVWHRQPPESLRAHVWALHGLAVDSSEEQLRNDLLHIFRAEDEALVRAHLPELLAHKTKSYSAFALKLSNWLARNDAARAEHITELVDAFVSKSSLNIERYMLDKKQHAEGSPLYGVIHHWAVCVQRYCLQLAALACAEETFAVAVLARALDLRYGEAKEVVHALDYDDLIARTWELLTTPDMMGWVMSKLDHRIDHVLIDEAQDNSAVQWGLAKILVDELMATNDGAGSAGVPRSLLVVGDEKQSIYSFQGAAPEEFSRYHLLFKNMLEKSASPLCNKTLAKSWRSTAAVLRVVDAVCAESTIARALTVSGAIASHTLTREREAGCVMLYPLVIVPEKQVLPALVIPKDYALTSTATQVLADKIADTIEQWLDAKRPLLSKNRPIEAGDILILVRKRGRLVQTLIRALQRRKVPVAGMDRLKLAKHLAVGDMLALMRWCLNESDDLALAQVLRSPLVGLSDDELRALAHGRTGALWPCVSNPWLAEMRALKALSPYDFLTQVLEVSNRRHDFARRFGEEIHEILDELKAQAASMPATMPQTLAQFHDWMSGSTREIKRESEASSANVVRIMTVHGAKGLEAPIVILADTVDVPHTGREMVFAVSSSTAQQPLAALSISEISKHAPRLLEAKEAKKNAILAEYYRLLYVALTRARDELHVFGTASKKGAVKEGSWYAVVASAMHACAASEVDDVRVVADAIMVTPQPHLEKEKTLPLALPAWANMNPEHEVVSTATLSPSAIQAAQAYGAFDGTDARDRGVRIHRVLELLRPESDAAGVAQLIAHVAPDWDKKTQALLGAKITALRASEPWLWAHKRRVEVNVSGTIVHGGEAIAVSGQIDLLIETPNEIIILDYKTGAHLPTTADEVSLNYVLQLKVYHALVTQIYPALPVRCAIVWTHDSSLMWLDERVAATPFPDKNVMLKTGIAA